MAVQRLYGALYKSFRKVVAIVNDLSALANELRTDHATIVTFQTEAKADLGTLATFSTEMVADHATLVTLLTEIIADHDADNDILNTIISREYADQVLAGAVAGLSVDGVNPENAETDNAIYLRHKGLDYSISATAEIDISALTAGGDTITQNKSGALWIFTNTAGTIDAETDKAAADYDSVIEALAQYSVATNTLPPGTDDVCTGVIYITEDNSGAFTWGTDSLTAESASYVDFWGLPGIETAMASFALDGAAATFTYGAATIRLGSGSRVAMTGKANVTISGSNVADGNVGAWLFYGLADDTEIAVQLGAAYADLATAQAAVRDHTPNPYLALLGVIYVQNASGGDFIPGTTNLDAANITATFTTLGTGSNQLEVGRAALNQPYSAIAADLAASNIATLSATATSAMTASPPATLAATAADTARFGDSTP